MSLPVENIKATLAEALPQLQKKYPVKALALFGSATRKDFDPDKSDIDILVELSADMDWNYFDLCYEIQSLFPHKKVDVVSRGAIQEQYWQVIEKDLDMPERDEKVIILDILQQIQFILEITKGISKEEFFANQLIAYAADRALEIIGEANKQLPQSFLQLHQNIEWIK